MLRLAIRRAQRSDREVVALDRVAGRVPRLALGPLVAAVLWVVPRVALAASSACPPDLSSTSASGVVCHGMSFSNPIILALTKLLFNLLVPLGVVFLVGFAFIRIITIFINMFRGREVQGSGLISLSSKGPVNALVEAFVALVAAVLLITGRIVYLASGVTHMMSASVHVISTQTNNVLNSLNGGQ